MPVKNSRKQSASFCEDVLSVTASEESPAGISALRKLVGMVAVGAFKPGESLREARLADELGTNRNAVREALNQLVSIDVMEYIPYCGYRLLPYTLRDMLEWHELRLALEPMALKLSESRPVQKLLPLYDKMAKILDVEEKCMARNDVLGRWRCDISFHLKLVESSGNRRLISASLRGALGALASGGCPCIPTADGCDRGKEIPFDMDVELAHSIPHKLHRQILHELTHGNVDEAILLLTKHIEIICRRIRGYLVEQSLEGSAAVSPVAPISDLDTIVDNLLKDHL